MKSRLIFLLDHARSDAGRRALRYVATSGVGVVTTQLMLAVFQWVMHWPALPANLVACTIMAFPMFLLNKHWVWGKSGKAHMRREVLPFWLFTVAGLALSMVAVAVVVAVTRDPAVPGLEEGNRLAVQFANLFGFGVLWVLKYLFLDRIMFGPHHHTPYDEDLELEVVGSGADGSSDVPKVAPTPETRP